MAHPSYKLTYLNGRGKGEIVRLVLTAAGVPFTDERVDFEWVAKNRASLPFGQVPVLEIDSKIKLCQGISIARYLARKYNLAGKTDLEQAQADMTSDCMEDIIKTVEVYSNETDPNKKEELKKKFFDEQFPALLTRLEALLVANKGGDGYFVGDQLTWADLYLIRLYGYFDVRGWCKPTPFQKHPKLDALCKRVLQLPKIAHYYANQPVTEW